MSATYTSTVNFYYNTSEISTTLDFKYSLLDIMLLILALAIFKSGGELSQMDFSVEEI